MNVPNGNTLYLIKSFKIQICASPKGPEDCKIISLSVEYSLAPAQL